jgi:hypothetical protein
MDRQGGGFVSLAASPRSIEQLREAAELPLNTPAGRAISDEELERVLARVNGDVDFAAIAITNRCSWVRELLGRNLRQPAL